MRSKAVVSLAVICASVCAALALPAHADMTLDQLQNLTPDTLPASAGVETMRESVLRETAIPLGSHKGLADRGKVLLAELESRATKLDKLYRFNALVMKNGMLPPVITEARDAVQATTDQVRVADVMYNMPVHSRFVTVAPSWRDYLPVGLRASGVDELPVAAVLPKTAAERSYWKQQIAIGYQQGVALADQIFETNLARLNRDYMGMLRYSELLNKGLVTEPKVAVAPSVVSGDRQHLNVGDTLYRVTDHGGFVTDDRRWQSVVGPAVPLDSVEQGTRK